MLSDPGTVQIRVRVKVQVQAQVQFYAHRPGMVDRPARPKLPEASSRARVWICSVSGWMRLRLRLFRRRGARHRAQDHFLPFQRLSARVLSRAGRTSRV